MVGFAYRRRHQSRRFVEDTFRVTVVADKDQRSDGIVFLAEV